jgi:HlyD family secretion protein
MTMRPLTRYLFAALILAGAGALTAAWPRTELDVIAEPASTGPIVREIVAHSTLQATTMVDVEAQVSGEVQALEVDERASVHAGDIMARIDPAPFEQALRDARATLAYLEQDEGSAPARIVDAQRAIRDAERDLERTIVRAPVDGIVVVRNVSVGQIVSTSGASPLLYRIATDLHHLEVDVDIPKSQVAELRQGSDVVVTVDERNGVERHGRVARVAATATVDVPNADLQLRPGTAVTAAIVLERKDNVLRVPSNALAFAPPEGSSSIVDATDLASDGSLGEGVFELWRYQRGRLTPVAVRVGMSGEGWTEIDSGLEDGDQVATGVVARRASMLSTIWIP